MEKVLDSTVSRLDGEKRTNFRWKIAFLIFLISFVASLRKLIWGSFRHASLPAMH